VAEGRGDVKEIHNITKKLSRRRFRGNKPITNNKEDILATRVEQ
jgi:hypothetical protein